MYELKIYRGVTSHENEEWCKIWTGIDLPVQNWRKGIWRIWPEHSRIPTKICTLMGCFWPRYIMFELKKYRGVLFGVMLSSVRRLKAKFGWNLTCGFKNDMKNFSSFHGLKNSNFILESKRAELKQNKNSKQPDGPDAVWQLYFTLELNE